ncbi:MAG: 23S rRNA (adenine(2503)-C(2))-methyltransferase RlmN [Chloroflexi bacterium]|nr:23S rRNA (adenine(2503)-C(2))-methyltransferase RlmN [Chloroflexota bacterium]
MADRECAPGPRPAASAISDSELARLLPDEPRYRRDQVRRGIYDGAARGFDQITSLPRILRERLDMALAFSSISPDRVRVAGDGTRAFLFRTADDTIFETVQLPSERGTATTVCVSSQAGCAMGCTFCATGTLGLTRNLSAAEIVDQFLHVRRESRAGGAPDRIVFMGMGEPLANTANVHDAIEALVDPGRGGLGARHVTVSTVGLPAGIAELTRWPWQVGLAISLHAASDDVRATLVPLAKHVDLATLMASSVAYQRATRRRVSYEYTMLRDVNDHVGQARDLARLVDGQTCHVNLIPFNPFPGAAYEAPSAGTTRRFRDELLRHGVAATIRRTRGREIAGACGQLRADGAIWRRRSQGAAPARNVS